MLPNSISLNVLTPFSLTSPKRSQPQLDQFATRICQEHQHCITSPQTALIHACNAGVWLLKAQASLSPTEWEIWLKTECNLTLETAQTYMQMAKKLPTVPLERELTSEPQQITSEQPSVPPKNSAIAPEIIAVKTPEKERVEAATPSTVPLHPFSVATEPTQTESESVIDVDFTTLPAQSPQTPSSDVIRFCIPGAVVPKARPRVTSNGTYLPNRYRAWRNRAEVELYCQMANFRATQTFPLRKAAVSIRFFGKHRTNSDLDNLAGACLDALTLNGAGVLMDDRLSCLPQLSVEYIPDTEETGVWIEIQPL